MSASDRITLVQHPAKGSSLEKITAFAEAGMSVAVGRSLAVVDARIDGSLALHAQEMLDLLHRINTKVGGYDAILDHDGEPSHQMWQERKKALGDIWNLLAKVQGDAPVGDAAQTQFDLDDHVKLVADALRHRWLRDVSWDTPRQELAIRDRSNNILIDQDLDAEIDCAMQAYPGEQENEPCAS